jgi:hypothetical protein
LDAVSKPRRKLFQNSLPPDSDPRATGQGLCKALARVLKNA